MWCWKKTSESALDSKEIKLVNLKGNHHWILIGRTNWSSNILVTWCKEPTHKRPWCWERLRAEEEGISGWDGWMASLIKWHELGQTLGDGDGQACCSPWSHEELNATGQLNNEKCFVAIRRSIFHCFCLKVIKRSMEKNRIWYLEWVIEIRIEQGNSVCLMKLHFRIEFWVKLSKAMILYLSVFIK